MGTDHIKEEVNKEEKIKNEIISYNGNFNEFIAYNDIISHPLNFPSIINKKNNEKYIGETINNKYNGRGILYDSAGNLKYNGYFKDGSFEGFGRKYNLNKLEYEGFFKNNNYNGKGILYKNGIKKYEGYFSDGKYDGIGIEYLSDGETKKRKMLYSYGRISSGFGILYYNNNEQYRGFLEHGKPKIGKNITIYGENDNDNDSNDNIIYIGDFYNFKYNGKGILYYKNSNQKLYEGYFKDDKYVNGILYNIDGSKKYDGYFKDDNYHGNGILYIYGSNQIFFEGEFKEGNFSYGNLYNCQGKIIYNGEYYNNNPENGKNITLYDMEGHLRYQGDVLFYEYNGNGKLYQTYKGITYLKYDGKFKESKFNGIGKLYEIYNNNDYYLYYKGSFQNNEFSGKGVKFYINGNKKIEGVFNNINSYEGIYYSPEKEIVYKGNILDEISMYLNGNIIYNDLGFKTTNKLFIHLKTQNKEISVDITKRIRIGLVSDGVTGKTCLVERLINNEYICQGPTIGFELYDLNYEYNNELYNLKLFDTNGSQTYRNLILPFLKTCFIILYIFDLTEDEDINETYFDIIKNLNNKKIFYLIGNKSDERKKHIKKYRNQAKKLFDKGKIYKYFEVSCKTGEGIDLLLNNLKYDCSMIEDIYNSLYSQKVQNNNVKKCLIF